MQGREVHHLGEPRGGRDGPVEGHGVVLHDFVQDAPDADTRGAVEDNDSRRGALRLGSVLRVAIGKGASDITSEPLRSIAWETQLSGAATPLLSSSSTPSSSPSPIALPNPLLCISLQIKTGFEGRKRQTKGRNDAKAAVLP